MLKIKDNVNLKELEKFGFVSNGYYYDFKRGSYKEVSIDIDNRVVCTIIDGTYPHEASDVIYDLITAGFIEQIKE